MDFHRGLKVIGAQNQLLYLDLLQLGSFRQNIEGYKSHSPQSLF